MFTKRNKAAFTLAEMLITLVIIGIVAVLTIPAITQNYKKHVTSIRLKKFYSTMTQAIRLSEIENGSIKNWSFSSYKLDAHGIYIRDNYQYAQDWWKKYILPYMNYDRITVEYFAPATAGDNNVDRVYIYLADGSCIIINYATAFQVIYDVNGKKSPNDTRDRYFFDLYLNTATPGFTAGTETDRAKALEKCQKAAYSCVNLLWLDNWEFKEDYPYKL